MKQIVITIDSEANVVLETSGYRGKQCSLDSKILTDALGVTTKDVKKPAYHQDTVANQSVGS